MPTHNRSSDFALITQTATNTEAIVNLKEGQSELREKVIDLETKIDELKDDVRSISDEMRQEMRDGHNAILKRLDLNDSRQTGRFEGASWLAKGLYVAIPSGSLYILGKIIGIIH